MGLLSFLKVVEMKFCVVEVDYKCQLVICKPFALYIRVQRRHGALSKSANGDYVRCLFEFARGRKFYQSE